MCFHPVIRQRRKQTQLTLSPLPDLIMEDDQSNKAIQGLLQGDLGDLEDQQKGKQRAGSHTDPGLAIDCMRNDVLSSQVSMQDPILAQNVSFPADTDMEVLASIQHEERVAEHDHEHALALDNRPMPAREPSTTREYDTASIDENYDAMSVEMGDITTPVMSEQESDNGEGSARAASLPEQASSDTLCDICSNKGRAILWVGKCSHELCFDCIQTLFLNSIRDENLYPPRCCSPISSDVAHLVLNDQKLREFHEKSLEWTEKNRIYCADPNCSKFIPRSAIRDDHGTCPKCHQKTHVPCRSLMHHGVDCPIDEHLPMVLAVAEVEGWKRCPSCRMMVERNLGCHRMTCR